MVMMNHIHDFKENRSCANSDFFSSKLTSQNFQKTWFRDNGQSLGHAFSKAIENPRSAKIEGRENNFSDTFSASDRKTNFLKI